MNAILHASQKAQARRLKAGGLGNWSRLRSVRLNEESGFSILQHRIAMADDALMKEDVSSVDEVAFVSLVGLCRGHRIPSVLR